MSTCCIVVPCYNESGRIQTERFDAFLKSHGNFSLLFVDDGSTDGTAQLLKSRQDKWAERWQVQVQPNNAGKAEAVRTGMIMAAEKGDYEYVGFLDADLSAPPETMVDLFAVLKSDLTFHSAFGSRVKRLGAHVERRTLRHIMGRVFATLVTQVLDVSSYDSQCGAKLFHSEQVSKLFSEPFVSNWLFDLELILRAEKQGIIEVPVREWREVGQSRMKLIDFINAPLALMRIRKHYLRS